MKIFKLGLKNLVVKKSKAMDFEGLTGVEGAKLDFYFEAYVRDMNGMGKWVKKGGGLYWDFELYGLNGKDVEGYTSKQVKDIFLTTGMKNIEIRIRKADKGGGESFLLLSYHK